MLTCNMLVKKFKKHSSVIIISDVNQVVPFECNNSRVSFPLPCSQFQVCQLGGQVSRIMRLEIIGEKKC